MSDPIILVRQGSSGAWSEPEISSYTDESHLQELLATDPTRIPGIPEGSKAVRELSTSAGPIDICVVSPSGAITVIECKLKKNSEPRRMVIGQVIDYASAIRADGYSSFRHSWLSRGGDDLVHIVEDGDVNTLEQNISRGIIHLCLAVDQIDEHLKRLVEYLYLISNDEIAVSAIQLTYAKHGSTEILIPTTYGMEIAQAKASARLASSERWTWESFVAALTNPDDQSRAHELKRLLDESPMTGSTQKLWFGSKPFGGIYFYIHGESNTPFQIWINASGRLVLTGNWSSIPGQKNHPGFAEFAAFLGQDHLQSARNVLVSDFDISELWRVATECDRRINNAPL